MTIETRKPKMNQTKVTPLDFGEWTHFEVKGKEDTYHVYIPAKPIKDNRHFEYRPTCHSKADPHRFPVCKGNSNGAVCYHILAAIKYRVAKCDKVLSLPKNGEKPSAVKLLNLGGQLVKIVNQNGKAVWGTVR